MTNKEKKQLAYSLFIKSSLTRKEIASNAGCTEKTLRNWIEQGGWDELKESETITRGQLLQDAYAQLKAINKEVQENHNNIPNKELSDAKAIIRKEIEALTVIPIHKYVEVMMEFTKYVQMKDPARLQMNLDLMDGFIAHIANQQKGA